MSGGSGSCPHGPPAKGGVLPSHAVDPSPAAELAGFLRAHREQILAEWERSARPAVRSKGLSAPALLDDVPHILDDLAALVEAAPSDGAELPRADVGAHVIHRLAEGFDLAQTVGEYSLLRDAILQVWARAAPLHPLEPVRTLDVALDRAIAGTIELHTAEHNRTLLALDRISSAALESESVVALLDALLVAFMESCPAVDTAAVLLLEGDRLRVAATRGLGAPETTGFTLRLGEGFAGKVATERRALAVRDASRDPLVRGMHLRGHGIKALYGVPLVTGGELVGVAHAGSLRHEEFSSTDRQLLATMAERAAAGIRMHALWEQCERRAAELRDREIQQETVAELGARALAGDDAEALLGVATARVAAVLGADLAMVGEVVGGRLRMRAGFGWREGTVGRAELPLFPDSLAGLALHQHAPAVMEDVRSDPGRRLAPVVTSHGAVSGASVPVEHGAEHGVLSVYSRSPRRFRDFDLQFLQSVGYLLAVTLDRAHALSAIRASEAAARRSEERLRFLAEASTLLAGSLDPKRTAQQLTDLAVPRIADWCMLDLVSPDGTIRAAALSSADPDPLRAQRIAEFRETHPLRADSPYGLATVLRTGETLLVPEARPEVLRAIAPDEQYVRWIVEAGLRSLLAVPLRAPSGVLGVLSFGTSRSDRVLGEEERDLAQALAARAVLALENARLYEQAQRAVRLREEVLAVVSHDLKSPLNAIGLTAQLLGRKLAGDPGAQRNAASIETAAGRASAILGDLLDMASIQAGRLAVRLEPVDPADLAAEVMELQEPGAQERGVTISVEGGGPPVLADRGRIVQVLGNLLGNGVKFSEPGATVQLRVAEAAGGVRFEVSDAGPGIASENLPRIFEAYWSAVQDPAALGRERGSGLGLFIAKGILDAHGARLEVDSTMGRGTTFSFTLRRA